MTWYRHPGLWALRGGCYKKLRYRSNLVEWETDLTKECVGFGGGPGEGAEAVLD